jgi:serpin B
MENTNASPAQTPPTFQPSIQPPVPEKPNKMPTWSIVILLVFLIILGGSWVLFFNFKPYLVDLVTPHIYLTPTTVPPAFPTTTPTSEIPVSTSSAYLAPAHNAFGFDLFQKLIANEDKNTNVFISPESIALAFSMVLNGAAGETKTAIANVFHFTGMDITNINKASSNLISSMKNPDPNVEAAIANSIWAAKQYTFNPNFLETNKKYYNAEIQSIDFTQESSLDTINSWVSNNTRNKIPKILDKLDPNLVMYLINAIYFNGTWTYEFDSKLTVEKPFTLDNGQIKNHPFMTMERDDFMYLENNDFQAISLPYGKNKTLSMYIFLPKNQLDTFLAKMNLDNWKNWTSSFRPAEGIFTFPKFKIEYEKELVDTLTSMGMGIVFSEQANFSLIRSQRDLFISEVIHKTYIDVNEKGTEAAAATGIGMVAVMAPDKKTSFYMEVSKPFFFSIVDNTSGEILFMGAIREPKL